MKCINIQEHGGISVGDTVNIIRDESEGYRCPICKGACKFKTGVTTDDGIKVKGKVKCQYCHGLGEVSVKRYKAHAVKIESIEHWEDDDIIMRTNTLYNVFLMDTKFESFEAAVAECNKRNTNVYDVYGAHHISSDAIDIPNNSYVIFNHKKKKFFIDSDGQINNVRYESAT